jgi:hypothetical protein
MIKVLHIWLPDPRVIAMTVNNWLVNIGSRLFAPNKRFKSLQVARFKLQDHKPLRAEKSVIGLSPPP